MMTVDNALNILQRALDHCRVDDIDTPGIYGALSFLEEHSAMRRPFDNFRSALEFRRITNRDKEALWYSLNAAMSGIRYCVDGIKSE